MNMQEALKVILKQEGLSELPIAGAISGPPRQSILKKAWDLMNGSGEVDLNSNDSNQARLEV